MVVSKFLYLDNKNNLQKGILKTHYQYLFKNYFRKSFKKEKREGGKSHSHFIFHVSNDMRNKVGFSIPSHPYL